MSAPLSVSGMSSALKIKKRARPTESSTIAAEIELALNRKKALDSELLALERQIYALETSYLENTAQLGDLIRGWSDFTNPTSPGGPGGSTTSKKKRRVYETERIFSSSSVSARNNPEFHGLSNQSFQNGGNMLLSGAGHPSHVGHAGAQLEFYDENPLHFDLDMNEGPKKKIKKLDSTKKKTPTVKQAPKPSKNPSILDPPDFDSMSSEYHQDQFVPSSLLGMHTPNKPDMYQKN